MSVYQCYASKYSPLEYRITPSSLLLSNQLVVRGGNKVCHVKQIQSEQESYLRNGVGSKSHV